ncbi:MAG: hypothetical protein JRJ84_14110 [Deltaproteobacteria bacterium]|nr:hypothetical protein [Deltaproteobacteria bacterium]
MATSSQPWEAIPPSGEPLRARTFGEAVLYLRVRGAAILAARRTEVGGKTLVDIRVLHRGLERKFSFWLMHLDTDDLLHLGGGAPSELLDPVDLVLFASRAERELPETLEDLDVDNLRTHLRDLELGAEAADEATKFIPRRSDRVPESTLATVAARWLYDRDPERFSRSNLVGLAERLRRRAIWYQAVIRRLDAAADEEDTLS